MKSVSVHHVSKVYSIANKKNNFKEFVGENILNLLSRDSKNNESAFYALKDISFELDKGDVLGIIGDNGAGKSTLLKIISGVSQPSTGEVFLDGKISSILEIGTGFHMELSGRENIFLSGSILGMSKDEIEKNFASIVQFSGLEGFIDVAIKRYSSGMYLRLAFSVLAHLSTDIILLDEVIHVGDAEFRLKSYNKIKELAQSGKTILIISHDLASISDLCTKCMLLEKGEVRLAGKTHEIVRQYVDKSLAKYINVLNQDNDIKLKAEMQNLQEKIQNLEHNIKEKEEKLTHNAVKEKTLVTELEKLSEETQELYRIKEGMKIKSELHAKNANALDPEKRWEDENTAPGNQLLKIKTIAITTSEGEKTFNQSDDIRIELEYWKYAPEPYIIGLLVNYNFNHPALCTSSSFGFDETLHNEGTGLFKNACVIPKHLLNEGVFGLSFFFYSSNGGDLAFSLHNALYIKINSTPYLLGKFEYKNLAVPFAPGFKWS